jgi:hypothetical protein
MLDNGALELHDQKPWVITAIKSAQKELGSRIWENDPTQETIEARRITLIKRLRR